MRKIHEQENSRLRRILLSRAEGSGTGARAPGHVHPDRFAHAHHSGGGRQRCGRGAGRIRQEHPRHAACGRFRHRGRRRPRHSGRPASRGTGAGGGAGLHASARRRQVRQEVRPGRLCLLRRAAWRRRRRHQCLVDAGRSGGAARWPCPFRHFFREWREGFRSSGRRALRPPERNARPCLAGCKVFRIGQAACGRAGAPVAFEGRPAARAHGDAAERTGRGGQDLALSARAAGLPGGDGGRRRSRLPGLHRREICYFRRRDLR